MTDSTADYTKDYCGHINCLNSVPKDKTYCPKHDYPKPESKGRHQHQYIIPVEWDTSYYDKNRYKKVTKLRCSCGSEVERG